MKLAISMSIGVAIIVDLLAIHSFGQDMDQKGGLGFTGSWQAVMAAGVLAILVFALLWLWRWKPDK